MYDTTCSKNHLFYLIRYKNSLCRCFGFFKNFFLLHRIMKNLERISFYVFIEWLKVYINMLKNLNFLFLHDNVKNFRSTPMHNYNVLRQSLIRINFSMSLNFNLLESILFMHKMLHKIYYECECIFCDVVVLGKWS